MSAPRLLDLFCGAGGCSVGYARAGFEVVGVDVAEQPHYPFEFWQMDALDAWPMFADFDAIHASPPCQAWTHARHLGNRGRTDHPRLIEPVRALLQASGLPYVIENVEDARAELVEPFRLCGSMFGLPIERHRLFETNVPVLVPTCAHGLRGGRQYPSTPRADGSRPLSRVINPMASGTSHAMFAEAMGIDWIPAGGFRPTQFLREAIPPAYTEFIGAHLLAAVKAAA